MIACAQNGGRSAQVVRKQEFGAIGVADSLLRVAVVPDQPEYDEGEPPILETFTVLAESSSSPMFRAQADELIEMHRKGMV